MIEKLKACILFVLRLSLAYFAFTAVKYYFSKEEHRSVSFPIDNWNPALTNGAPLTFKLFISSNEQRPGDSSVPDVIFTSIYGLEFPENNSTVSVQFPKLESPAQNVYCHVLLEASPFPGIIYKRIQLVNWMTRFHDRKSTELAPYFYPKLAINVVNDLASIDPRSLPAKFGQYFVLSPTQPKSYFPILYSNEFWRLKENYKFLNETGQKLDLIISLEPITFFKLQLTEQFKDSFKVHATFAGETEVENIKRMLLETSPILLGITVFVSLLHSLFDFLAFKNDIQFWKDRKDFQGLSTRSVLVNCLFQFIIFLYLLDQDTSFLIIASVGIGLLIELWKIRKVLVISIQWKGIIPVPSFKDQSTYVGKTKEFDETAIRYLSLAAFPLLISYSIYCYMYEPFKDLYSFILSTLVGFVYAFGFIMMTPQLFINYKLKSVAHMPWKSFMYKALNTFVDDLFAFVIRMPWLHRLACFRDDVLFVIYLYQRWIYPVDKKRINEFGQGGEDNEEPESAVNTTGEVSDIQQARNEIVITKIQRSEGVSDSTKKRKSNKTES